MGHSHSHSHGRGGFHSHAPDPAAERDMEKKQSMGAYAFLHITLFSGLLYFDNRFKAALFGGEVLLPTAFIGLMVSGWILYVRVSYSNPGFVGKEEMRASGRNAKGYAAISTNEEDQSGPETAISIENPSAELNLNSQVTPLPSPPNAMNTSAASYQAMMAPLESQVGCNPAAAIANGAQTIAGPAAASNSTVIRVHEREDFCWHCSMIMPPRAKHCERCEQCVIKFDHHCPFVANCIGGKNHMKFWWFLFIETLQLTWVLYMCFTMFTELALDAFGEWLTRACFTIYAFIVLLMVSSLWGFHTYLACINKTTLEMVREQRAQFRARTRYLDESRNRVRGPPSYDEGFSKNIRMFCFGEMKPEWTKGIPHTPPSATFPQGSNTTYEQQARFLGPEAVRAIHEEAAILQQQPRDNPNVPVAQSYPATSHPQISTSPMHRSAELPSFSTPVVRRPSPSST